MAGYKARSALRDLRLRQGLSQSQLAAKSGVARTLLVEAEGGTRTLSVEACLKSAPHLGIDAIGLYLSQTIPALKASIRSGKEPPIRAANVAKALVAVIETGELSDQQRKAARRAVEELVALVEEAAEQRGAGTLSSLVRGSGGPLDPPMRDDVEDETQRAPFSTAASAEQTAETYRELGRDPLGRRIVSDEVMPDMDYFPESGSPVRATFRKKKKSTKSAEEGTTLNEFLDRDSFGRRKPK
jgi:transcriptional regulator with XRE-family HTH domain